MDAMHLADGAIFARRYRVVRRIAHGGMGAVYEVVHIETTRHRALKVMLPNLVESSELRQRFRLEARVAAQIESAYIVDVFDAGVDEETNVPFLVMELLRGEELGKRLKRVGKFNNDESIDYLRQTALALDKTHRAHIVHRDLKPENLFLSEQEGENSRIKVLDFGVAKFVAEQGTAAHATRSLGTPLYMAPEQLRPRMKVSAATDIFALGMIAFSFLTGKPYWYEEQQICGNVFAFMSAVLIGPTEPATQRAQRRGITLPRAFDAWFTQITAQDPNARFSSAIEAISELTHVLAVTSRTLSVRGTLSSKASSTTIDLSCQTLVIQKATTDRAGAPERVTVEISPSSQSLQHEESPREFGVVPQHTGICSRSDTDNVQTLGAAAFKKNPTLRRIGAGAALAVALGVGGKQMAMARHDEPPLFAVVGVKAFEADAAHDLPKQVLSADPAVPEKQIMTQPEVLPVAAAGVLPKIATSARVLASPKPPAAPAQPQHAAAPDSEVTND